MTPILAICNHKGGTGKTSATFALARHWQRQARPPLAIDLDPQANLSRVLAGVDSSCTTIGDVLARRTTIQRATQRGVDGISFVGADIRLEDTSAAIQGKSPNHQFLASALRSGALNHGVVLIDCAPAANILTINALVAATHVLIVLDPELDAIDGMRRIRTMVGWLGEELGAAPQIVGAVINKVQGQTLLHRTNLETILGELDAVGIVPYRRGQDAEQQIDDAFAPIAATIWSKLEESANA
jgi:chromosome partitioning protein